LIGGVPLSSVISASLPAFTTFLFEGSVEASVAASLPAYRAALIAYLDAGPTATIDTRLPRIRSRSEASFPVQYLTLTINGENVGDNWKLDAWTVTKDGSIEDGTFTLEDAVESASAFRVEKGSIVLLEHPVGGLIYGGRVKKVTDSRIGEGKGVRSTIETGDWMFLAQRQFIDPQTFLPTELLIRINEIYEKYLESSGVENLVPSGESPDIPELIVDEPISVQEFFDRHTELIGWPWRINGLLKFAFVEPGSLIWPGGELNGSNAKLVPDVKWEEEETISYNFLYMKLAKHPAGEGPYAHSETRFGDGVRTVFPVNVLPTEVLGELNSDHAVGSGTLTVKGLPPGAKVRYADELYVSGDVRKYYVGTGGTVNDEGIVTFSISELLELEAKEGAQVTFVEGAMIDLVIDGVDTDFAGDPWVWDKTTKSFVNPVAAPGIGQAIKYKAWVRSEGWVRAWETSDPQVQLPIGWFDYTIMSARKVDNEDHWEWVETVGYLRDLITKDVESKRTVMLTTHEHGIYPFIQADLNFPERLIFGPYICEKVEIAPIGADKTLTDKELAYNCTFRKDYFGKKEFDFWRPVSQIRWGEGEQPLPPDFQWSASREYVLPGEQTGFVLNPLGEWEWTDWLEVNPSMFSAAILTGIVIERTDAYQPYGSWTKKFEVEVAISVDGGDPETIARFKGYSRDTAGGAETGTMRLMTPVDNIPQGCRLLMRMRDSSGGFLSVIEPWEISLQVYFKPVTGNVQTTPYVQEVSTPGEDFTVVTTNATPNTFSAWTEIIEEFTYDALVTALMLGPRNFTDWNYGHIQLAIADVGDTPSTDDQIVWELAFSAEQEILHNHSMFELENPLYVNSGKSLHIRVKSAQSGPESFATAIEYVRVAE